MSTFQHANTSHSASARTRVPSHQARRNPESIDSQLPNRAHTLRPQRPNHSHLAADQREPSSQVQGLEGVGDQFVSDQPWPLLLYQFDPLVRPRVTAAEGPGYLDAFAGHQGANYQVQPPPAAVTGITFDDVNAIDSFDPSLFQDPNYGFNAPDITALPDPIATTSPIAPSVRQLLRDPSSLPVDVTDAAGPTGVPIPRLAPSSTTISSNSSRGRRPRRYTCNISPCPRPNSGFTRHSDLTRHQRAIHSAERFRCLAPQCGHSTNRKDKMQEHCQTQHQQAQRQEVFDGPDASEISLSSSPSFTAANTPASSSSSAGNGF